MNEIVAPAFIRGTLISDHLSTFSARYDGVRFLSPDPARIVGQLPLDNPGLLSDLYTLKFADIADYLVSLGTRLKLEGNVHLQAALSQSYAVSDHTPSLLRWQYGLLPSLFTRPAIYEVAERQIGIRYLERWNDVELTDGRVASIKAFGARTVHIIAGNSPLLAAITVIRNAVTRSDAIIKAPSNDPLTALAIAQTMRDMAPEHPLTRHLSVAYWKGGMEAFEAGLYSPQYLEKIVAWGGLASVRHVTRYIQPGLELITLDPKRSATVIGREAFESEGTMRDVARRAATDIGALNQLGCVAARVIFVESGTEESGLSRLRQLGNWIYEELLRLPNRISTAAKHYDQELKQHVAALGASPDFYGVVGGREGEGAIVISLTPEPVEFYTSLSGRTANLVPLDDSLGALRFMNAYTQTVGVYPESLKKKLRDVLPLYGAQRLVTLGYANTGNLALPQDAIEPLRRMVRWIVEETCTTRAVPPLWALADEVSGA